MPKNFFKILFYVFTLIFFSSCITSRTVNYMQKPGLFIPHYKDTVFFEDYKLRKGDRIYITVYSTDEKTNMIFNGSSSSRMMSGSTSSANDLYTYLVDESGNINLPMVGELNIEGKTVREATVVVEKAIESLFKFSTVEMKIAQRYFSIIGNSVNGLIQMPKEKINIFQALALAGDIGVSGDRSKLKILRENPNGTTTLKTFDVRSEDIVHSSYFYVEPNDVIYIQDDEKQFFSVTNLPMLFSTVLSTASFGVFIYDILVPSTSNSQ